MKVINNIKSRIIFSVLLIGFSSSLLANATKEELRDMKKIVGYFPNWGVYKTAGRREYFVNKIPWDKLTHVNIAFAQVAEETFEFSSPDEKADFHLLN
jgi:GH18 family chitinase